MRSPLPAGCLAAILLLAARPFAAAAGVSLVAGAGVDWETAESSPARLLAGLRLSDPVIDLRITADCGLPWEPSVRVDAGFTAWDGRLLRLGISFSWWLRAWASAATEAGTLVHARAEIGPRIASLSAAGGFAARSTFYPAVAATLRDSYPWARVGVCSRPLEQARFELAVSSDGALALWLRTSFELSAWWRLPCGLELEGLLAARYTDLFTLTSYLDGFDARAVLLVPLGGGSSP